MGSGNLGSMISQGSDRGLPPLPSANLLSESRESTGLQFPDTKLRRTSFEGAQADAGKQIWFGIALQQIPCRNTDQPNP